MILEGSPKQIGVHTQFGHSLCRLQHQPYVRPKRGRIAARTFHVCVLNDLNQRYVTDMGLPGPDDGTGGKHPASRLQGRSSIRVLRSYADYEPRPAHASRDSASR
jgi:hypothetical protein